MAININAPFINKPIECTGALTPAARPEYDFKTEKHVCISFSREGVLCRGNPPTLYKTRQKKCSDKMETKLQQRGKQQPTIRPRREKEERVTAGQRSSVSAEARRSRSVHSGR